MTSHKDKLHIAIPDGHQMNHFVKFIEKAGIGFEGYSKSNLNRRPTLYAKSDAAKKELTHSNKYLVKVIRPQDMPIHVANQNFDIAISGIDWLTEHKLRFPKSPVVERIKLGFGKVRIVAAIHKDYVNNISSFLQEIHGPHRKNHLRIASEYVYIADHYAQNNYYHPYRVIMTYGATESLIPEDCDMIIENTETGNTLRKNNLDIIDSIMTSEGCLIANSDSLSIPWKKEMIEGIESLFQIALSH